MSEIPIFAAFLIAIVVLYLLKLDQNPSDYERAVIFPLGAR